jgi:hypothetical protein
MTCLDIFSAEDELPMTMQVGMVACDGVILASDTKTWGEPFGRTITSGLSKIRVNEESGIAIPCAKDLAGAYQVADAIIENLLPQSFSAPEQRICEVAIARLKSAKLDGGECMIALSGDPPALYLFSSGQRKNKVWARAYCSRVATYVFGGHIGSAATFWADRFFRPDDLKMRTMDELIPLAAQIIVDAGRLSSGNIGGFELVRCDATGIHPLSLLESNQLEVEAQKRSKSIEGLLFA